MFKTNRFFKLTSIHLNHLRQLTYCGYDLTVANVFQNCKKGDNIEIKGWVKAIRKLKDNTFIDLSDGSSNKKLQITLKSEQKPESLTYGCSITATGNLNVSPKGDLELNAEKCDVLGPCTLLDGGYPFLPKKTYNDEYVRQFLHFRPRTNKFSSLIRTRSLATYLIHEYFNREGYVNVHTPILTSNDCEGAGEVFTVYPESKKVLEEMRKPNVSSEEAYFDSKVFLTVSGQLHLEVVAHGISKVYTFGPTFRAENSRSRLHLSEFYMLEAEIGFVDHIEQLCIMLEHLIKCVTKNIYDKAGDDLNQKDDTWFEKEFPILTYDEALLLLQKHDSNFNSENGLMKENEIRLVELCGNVPTFIINFPKDDKPFYMRECEQDPTKVLALDLLAPGVGEIVGGSIRENNYDKLKSKLPRTHSLDWYLDLRKYGSVPTAGYGLGFERYLQFILGISNIKDTIPFPRWPHNCKM